MNGYYSEMAERNKAIQTELEGYMEPPKKDGGGSTSAVVASGSDDMPKRVPSSAIMAA